MPATLFALALAAAYAVHALHYAFLQDDAYIFLRYADHVLAGHGPVWNAGERVEGYTSPLWLALLVALRALAPAVEPALHGLTLALGGATLLLTFRLGRLLSGGAVAGWLAACLLASDRSFAVWSTSGMDTRLYGCLAVALSLATVRVLSGHRTRADAARLGLAMLLVSWSRPEGLLLAALALTALLVGARREGVVRVAAIGAGIAVAGVFGHLAWRLAYYGALLPNTFHAKVTGLDPAAGALYLADFALSFPHLVLVAPVALWWIAARAPDRLAGAYLVAVPLAYLVYLLAIGGGFMEFRMLDVLLPGVYACVAVALAGGLDRRPAAALAALLVAANLWSGLRFDESRHVVMSQRSMAEDTTHTWVGIGRWLARIAREGESVATTAAGAIPYYSGLPAVDMLGLNDAHVASLPPDPARPVGHRRVAPEAYLRERGITFVLGHPRTSRDPRRLARGRGDLVVEVDHGVAGVNGGRPFYLAFSTTGDPRALARSLRERGVRVLDRVP